MKTRKLGFHEFTPWLADVGPRERAVAAVLRHITAELGADVDEIMSTVSKDPWFLIPDPETGQIVALDTTEAVRTYYQNRGYDILGHRTITSIAGDSYVLRELVVDLRPWGNGGANDDPEGIVATHGVVLFPIGDDGLVGGEVFFLHDTGALVPSAAPRDIVVSSGAEADTGRVVDAELEALRGDGYGNLLSLEHPIAVKIDALAGPTKVVALSATGAEAAASLQSLTEGAEGVAAVNVSSTQWYVFGEYVARYDGGSRYRQLALLHRVRDGKLTATLGYGRERRA